MLGAFHNSHIALRLFPALVWLLALPALWYSLVAAPQLRVEVGQWGDHTMLRGINGIEESSSENYRWTMAETTLAVPNLSDRYRLLRFRAHGWRPEGLPTPQLAITAADRPWTTIQLDRPPRVFRLILPRDAARPSTEVGFRSDVYEPPGDPRTLGFALDWIELDAGGAGAPTLWQFGGQALLLALLALLIALLGLGAPTTIILSLLMPGAILAANLVEPLWVGLGLPYWLSIAAILPAVTWMATPGFSRTLRAGTATLAPASAHAAREQPWLTQTQARLAWALLVAALLVRLAGASHPMFDARDMPVHTRWLTTVAGGELYLYSTPAELQNRKTFNPPAGYVLLQPLWLLLGEARLTVQVGVALLDGLIAPLLLLLARELRLTARAGLYAMGLYTALPIVMTMMWWGFAANAIAQVWWTLLLWLMLRLTRAPTPALFAAFTVVAILCLTTHIGAVVVLAPVLALLALLGWRMTPGAGWRALTGGLALAAVFTVLIYVSAAAAPLGGAERSPTTLNLEESLARGLILWPERVGLVSQALTLGFLPPILGLAAAGLPLLLAAHTRHPLQRLLIIAVLLTCILFFFVYVGLSLLTRYIYFAVPLICLAAAIVLARLASRPTGRWIAIAVVVFVAWSGALLWFDGVLLRIKPSLVPLTQ